MNPWDDRPVPPSMRIHGAPASWLRIVLMLATLLATLPALPAAEILIPTNTVWRFAKGTNEVSAPLSAWRQRAYNEGAWASGTAPFYFGETLTGTLLNDMVNRYSCVFLRRTFVVTNVSQISQLTLRAASDDGFVAWINGFEVARYNLATNLTPLYSDVAAGSAPEPIQWIPVSLPPPARYLAVGTNVLALQAFNRLIGNADFQIHAELSATVLDGTPPVLVSIDPAPGSTLPGLTSVRIVFSEAVTNVAADDLTLNGAPATGLVGDGAAWEFQFEPPASGLVQLAWDGGQSIADLAGNRFDASGSGAGWGYTINDTVPPTVDFVTPAPGAAVASLQQVEVRFSEAILGLDAADLSINGRPAARCDGSGRGPYVFQFPEPAAGTVRFSWNPGHGITDASPGRNAFAGGSWLCELNPSGLVGDVLLNEILAVNRGGRIDEDGDASDWIELRNRGTNVVPLKGWSLTDDPGVPGLWEFPEVNLPAGGYLVVFASGKDRKPVDGKPLHTSFQLAMDGEYLGLFNAESPRRAAAEFRGGYPEQRAGISYGVTTNGAWAYSLTPTPGAANASTSSLSGVVAAPEAGVCSGFFDLPFRVSLGCATPGAEIRFTLDGTVPAPGNGALYTAPILVQGTTNRAVVVLRAAAFLAGRLPSRTTTHTYLFPDLVLRQPRSPAGFPTSWITREGGTIIPGDYELDPRILNQPAYAAMARRSLTEMPTLSLVLPTDDLFGRTNGLYSNPEKMGVAWERACAAEFLFPEGSPGIRVDAGLRLQGGTSRVATKTYKHSLRLLFKGDHGPSKLEYPMFGGGVQRFDTLVLDAALGLVFHHRLDPLQRMRPQYVRDQFASDLQLAMGWPAPRGRFVHLYLNGIYWGLYGVHERPDASFAAAHYGGDKSEYDSIKNTTGFEVLDGTGTAWDEVMAMADARLTNNLHYEALAARVDIDNLIDYMLVNLWGGNTDWPHHNWYTARRQIGDTRFRFFSWDAEHVVKAVNEDRTGVNNPGTPAQLYDKLRLHNGEFRLRFADRVQRYFFNGGPCEVDPAFPAWDPAHPERNRPAALYMARIAEVDAAIALESARWGDTIDNPQRPGQPYERNIEWLSELAWVRDDYLPERTAVVLDQLKLIGLYPSASAAPVPSLAAGAVPAGSLLSLTSAGGTIYYTLDGSDPRAYGTGSIASSAREYPRAPFALTSSVRLRARTLHLGEWSALTEIDYVVGSPTLPLRFTEILYQPIGGDPYEYVELHNAGPSPLDIGGFSIDGLGLVFAPGTVLAPGQVALLASGLSPAAFSARYPGARVLAWFPGSLANGGETLTLRDAAGATVLSVTYDDSTLWPAAADGAGASLELADPVGDPDAPASWRASTIAGGTPGTLPTPVALPAVRFSEILAVNATVATPGAPIDRFPDWVEILNAGAATADLGGWSLSEGGNPRAFVFPEGTRLGAGARLLVFCDNETVPGTLHAGFQLSSQGGSIALFDASTNRVDIVTFGPQVADLSILRAGTGWKAGQPSPGAIDRPRSTASVTNLVINEWLADPPPGERDWIELFNRDPQRAVALEGLHLANQRTVVRIALPAFIAPLGWLRFWADEEPGPEHLDLKVSAGGDALGLLDAAGAALDRVDVSGASAGRAEGRVPDGSATIAMLNDAGTPGSPNRSETTSAVRINEILARNATGVRGANGQFTDWIELANGSAAAVDLSGASLTVRGSGTRRWRFPLGSTIPPGAFVITGCDDSNAASTNAGPQLNTGFTLEGDGATLELHSASGALLDAVRYGHQIADRSIGVAADGWTLLDHPTPGTTNSGPAMLGAVTGLRVNEWMAWDPSGPDWFELYNPSAAPAALAGLWLGNNPSLLDRTNTLIAPLSFIAPGGFARFIADADPGAGPEHVRFSLSALGEAITLFSETHGLVDVVYFGPQSPGTSEGRLPDGGAVFSRFVDTVTPGTPNFLPLDVVIHEVLAHTDPPYEDAVELWNLDDAPVDIGGWWLSDSSDALRKYRIPAGTRLAPRGFAAFYQYQFGGSEAAIPFDLDSVHGDEVWLSESLADGTLTGRRSRAVFGATANGVSIGRVAGWNGDSFVPLAQPTFGVQSPASVEAFRAGAGASNAPPRVGPVVISEIHYRPLRDGGTNEFEQDEFLELANLAPGPVALFDPQSPTHAWRLRGGVRCDLPQALTLPGGGCLVVVSFDPIADPAAAASFRARYDVPQETPLAGPFEGRLANAGEALRLERPDPPQTSGPEAGYVPYVLVEEVTYAPDAPWPQEPAWSGASLQRLANTGLANDPNSWAATEPAAGLGPLGRTDLVRLSTPRTGPDGTFRFTLHAAPATRCVIQGSSDLAAWSEVAVVLLETASREVILEPLPAGPPRFFRALKQP